MGLDGDKNVFGAGAANKVEVNVAPMDVRSKTAMFDQGQSHSQGDLGGKGGCGECRESMQRLESIESKSRSTDGGA